MSGGSIGWPALQPVVNRALVLYIIPGRGAGEHEPKYVNQTGGRQRSPSMSAFRKVRFPPARDTKLRLTAASRDYPNSPLAVGIAPFCVRIENHARSSSTSTTTIERVKSDSCSMIH